jgi:hypothetical protein
VGVIWNPNVGSERRLEKTPQRGASCFVLTKYHDGDEIMYDEMGGACSPYGRKDKYIQGFGRETRRNETTWKTLY